MPATKKGTDKYANILNQTVTQSAADTLTFSEINIGLNIFDKVGLLINRIEFVPSKATVNLFATNADSLVMALSASNQISSLSFSANEIIDLLTLDAVTIGAAASGSVAQKPLTRTYESLPGGGLLVAPKPLYFGVDSASLGTAGVVEFRLYFTVIQLKPDEYFELLESRRYFG